MNLRRWKKIQPVLLAAVAFLVITASPAWAADGGGFNPLQLLQQLQQYLQQLLLDALEWVKALGPVGAIAYIGIYIVATVAFLPGSILTLGAGVVFGVIQGSILVFIGATIGATIAFLVGRYVARGWISKKIEGNDKFAAIDRAVGKQGLKIVFLTRLSPIFPFNLLNYGMGVTGVSLRDYFLGSVGMIPGTIMYVYIGSLATDLATVGTSNQPTDPVIDLTIKVVGLIATVLVTVYVTKVARKALAEAVPETGTAVEQELS
ncbi:TVP38/TMEM64 family protein [Acaryochloris sp. CCMEE 5410]|uniref:TVP38/TMEM64 family protein n=1 Tax=Acaryochloris sp. CCMEE 5410 TaxID=310037 RepID=UPI0002484CA6|nr:TVP38/TMEM64 family protein [Acaryochloris sp. CCMEE 5410]